MLNSESSEFLNLDIDVIRNDLNAARAMAGYYREYGGGRNSINENYHDFAATLYRKAAAHSLLASESRAEKNQLFNICADMYRQMGNPYFHLMKAFTSDGFIHDEKHLLEDDDTSLYQNQKVYTLLASIQNTNFRYEYIVNELQNHRNTPIGILNIPLGDYLDLYESLSPQRFEYPITGEENRRSSDLIMQRFLVPYDNAVRYAFSDTYHWSMLALPFHPVEPDIVGLILLIKPVLERQNVTISSLINWGYLSRQTRMLLEIALRSYGIGNG